MTEQAKKAKHLYGRGWLGLIPLIGGFVGLGLIVLGLFKYRDRKLILIGFVALLPTVLIYGSMIYYFQFSEQYRKDYSQFCQPQMNDLIKHIEFYKTEHGSYPDSLEQLTVDKYALVIITDPILFNDQTRNRGRYYYKNLGNHYTLFSSGIDRVPYTGDDIFPSEKFFDSTKTGLIRAKE